MQNNHYRLHYIVATFYFSLLVRSAWWP